MGESPEMPKDPKPRRQPPSEMFDTFRTFMDTHNLTLDQSLELLVRYYREKAGAAFHQTTKSYYDEQAGHVETWLLHRMGGKKGGH